MSQPDPIDGAAGRTVFLIGTQPPPVHGMAMVNAAVAQRLGESGFTVRVLDIAAGGLGRDAATRLGRLWRVAGAALRFAAGVVSAPRPLLYMSVSGGWGQVYETVFALIARLRGAPVVLHHHSFRYIDRPAARTHWLSRAAGRRARHVALCPGMAARLAEAYGLDQVQALSNAAWLPPMDPGSAADNETPKRLGFLGTLTPEKGVGTAIKLAARLGAPYRLTLAGPFPDASTEAEVRGEAAGQGQVEFPGPLYGADKDAFMADTDVLLLPSQTEAEPVVVLEALARGIPVLASDAGCLPHLVAAPAGLTAPPGDAFIQAAQAQLADWSAHPDRFAAARTAARARFEALQAEAADGVEELLAALARA